MESHVLRKIALCTLILAVLIAVCIDDAGGARGGGRGGGRGRSWGGRSRSRSWGGRSTRSTRSYSNYKLSGRSLGSSSYTRNTWRNAALAGVIFGGIAYTTRYPSRRNLPPICTNNYENRPGESRKIGYFICPMSNQTSDYLYCCGPKHREFCCNKTMAQRYYGSRANSGGMGIGVVIAIVIGAAVVIGIVVFCCKKHKQAGQVLRKFSTRGRNGEHQAVPMHDKEDNGHQAPPPPQPVPPPAAPPVVQPPPYSAAMGYDAHSDGAPMPYGPPMSQPEIGFEKQPPIDGGAPYPPSAGGAAPYPPPAGNAPYPPYGPGTGAPYPPTGPGGYPPPQTPFAGAAYDTHGAPPYPPGPPSHSAV